MNEFESNQWFLKVLNGRDVEGQFECGNEFFMGEIVPKNDEYAFRLYMCAAEQGHADAMNNVADMYLNGEAVTKDYEQARYWFEQAAERYVPEAMFTLGMMYEQGLGVARNAARALQYYEQAASYDDVEAVYRLGEINYYGLLEQPISLERAREAFLHASSYEHADSLYNCGYFFEHGIGGEKSNEHAIFYYRLAAELGDLEAQERLDELLK